MRLPELSLSHLPADFARNDRLRSQTGALILPHDASGWWLPVHINPYGPYYQHAWASALMCWQARTHPHPAIRGYFLFSQSGPVIKGLHVFEPSIP